VPLKIATWNVNGIRKRQSEVQEWLAREQPDVACLQEIKAPVSQIPPALCEIEGYWCYWHGEGGYSGVGLHVRRGSFPDRPEFTHPPFDLETRIVAARVGALTVSSIYVPNGGRDFPAKMKFLDALDAFAETFRAAGAPVILCGDLNVARTERDVHPKERKPRAVGQLPEERALIERIIGRGLVDVGRALDPDNDGLFTWWAPWRNMRQRNIGWRLDYVLASESIAAKAQSSTVAREFGSSDHGPVTVVFDVEPASFATPGRPASAVDQPPPRPTGRLL
jgi:exodeoxyribonuclease-3